MKTIFLIIIGIVVLIGIIVSLNFALTISPLGSEHCPELELRKSLGLVDPTAACL